MGGGGNNELKFTCNSFYLSSQSNHWAHSLDVQSRGRPAHLDLFTAQTFPPRISHAHFYQRTAKQVKKKNKDVVKN